MFNVHIFGKYKIGMLEPKLVEYNFFFAQKYFVYKPEY